MNPNEILHTKSYRILRERLEDALDEGINAIVYGPPSSEKSYVLENLCAEFSKSRRVIYLYCGPRTTETHLYRGLAEALQLQVRGNQFRWACRLAVLRALWAMPELPAIVLDEAQHLDLDALEGVRQIHDMTRREGRKGAGVILAGSHTLLREFLAPQRRARLEQLLSRFPYRIQLEGMAKQEILTLAAKAFGNGKPAKLSEQQEKKLLERCTVSDPYHVGADGKPDPRTYLSSRRLLAYIEQVKKRGDEPRLSG